MQRKDSRGRNLRTGENQLKDGRYRYRYTDRTGKRRAVYAWRLVATDKTPAGKRDGASLREIEKAIEADTRDGVDGRAAAALTVNDMFDKYILTKTELKESTRDNYVYTYNHSVRESFGLKRLSDVKYSDVKSFYITLINDCGYKANSMEIINTILHPVFTLAVRDGYIRSNPTDGAMSEIKKSHNWERTSRHALTVEEQAAFIDFIKASDIYNHWLPLFTVFLGTGCRVGELTGLRWQDVDFDNNTISINHNLIYRPDSNRKCRFFITTPKTSSGCRTIPLLSEVKQALLIERRRQFKEGLCTSEIDGYSGFIFANKYGRVFIPQDINRAIKRIYTAYNEQEMREAAEQHRQPLLIRHFSVHNLRHTFCTRFCENETNIKVIQEIMGHSDISTTMNIYAEATESKKQESFKNLEGRIKIS